MRRVVEGLGGEKGVEVVAGVELFDCDRPCACVFALGNEVNGEFPAGVQPNLLAAFRNERTRLVDALRIDPDTFTVAIAVVTLGDR